MLAQLRDHVERFHGTRRARLCEKVFAFLQIHRRIHPVLGLAAIDDAIGTCLAEGQMQLAVAVVGGDDIVDVDIPVCFQPELGGRVPTDGGIDENIAVLVPAVTGFNRDVAVGQQLRKRVARHAAAALLDIATSHREICRINQPLTGQPIFGTGAELQ